MHGNRSTRFFLSFALLSSVLLSQTHAAEEKAEAPSGEKYRLAYKFEMGEVIRYAVKHTESLQTTIEGTSDRADCKTESVKVWKVTDVLPNGEMEIIHVVDSLKLTNRVPNRAEITFDSESEETPPPGYEQTLRTIGIPLLLFRIDSTGLMTHREEKHKYQESSEDRPITLLLPENEIAVGEQWDNVYNLKMQRKDGSTLKVRTRRVCTLKEVDGNLAKIHVKYQVLTPTDPHIQSQMAERMSEGHVYFDIERGRITSQRMEVDERVIGFVGKTSSMHCVSRMEEKLLKPGERLAKKKQAAEKK